MRVRFIFGVLLICVGIGSSLAGASGAQQTPTREGHVRWVAGALKRMETIKPGMTRKELLAVFTTEGGISTRLHRTFVSKDCPYFKADVEFEAVGRPGRDGNGRVTPAEDERDRILKISRPYLQLSILE